MKRGPILTAIVVLPILFLAWTSISWAQSGSTPRYLAKPSADGLPADTYPPEEGYPPEAVRPWLAPPSAAVIVESRRAAAPPGGCQPPWAGPPPWAFAPPPPPPRERAALPPPPPGPYGASSLWAAMRSAESPQAQGYAPPQAYPPEDYPPQAYAPQGYPEQPYGPAYGQVGQGYGYPPPWAMAYAPPPYPHPYPYPYPYPAEPESPYWREPGPPPSWASSPWGPPPWGPPPGAVAYRPPPPSMPPPAYYAYRGQDYYGQQPGWPVPPGMAQARVQRPPPAYRLTYDGSRVAPAVPQSYGYGYGYGPSSRERTVRVPTSQEPGAPPARGWYPPNAGAARSQATATAAPSPPAMAEPPSPWRVAPGMPEPRWGAPRPPADMPFMSAPWPAYSHSGAGAGPGPSADDSAGSGYGHDYGTPPSFDSADVPEPFSGATASTARAPPGTDASGRTNGSTGRRIPIPPWANAPLGVTGVGAP
ncbi:MAG: hypothetical protein H7840_07120 [Alphaproteobacteria bacterium]